MKLPTTCIDCILESLRTGNPDASCADHKPPVPIHVDAPPSPAERPRSVPSFPPAEARPSNAEASLDQPPSPELSFALRQDRAAHTRAALARLLAYNRSRGLSTRALAGITGYTERYVRKLIVVAGDNDFR